MVMDADEAAAGGSDARPGSTTYLAGALGFLAVLFVFYAHLELLLPGNF